MKSNKAMGTIQTIILVVIIGIIVAMGVYFIRMKYGEAKLQTVKTDMLQVQWKVKDYMDKRTAEKKDKVYLGTKIAEAMDDPLVQEFLNKNVLSEEEYEKYYVLKDQDLQEAGLEITNYEDSYYLVNYDEYEIIMTKGFKYNKTDTLYRLSQIKEVTETIENKEK